MNTKQIAIGTLAGGVTLYVLGYIIWSVLFVDFFAANAGSATDAARDTHVQWALAVGTLSYAALLTLAIGGRTGSVTIMDGLKMGAVAGFLLWFTACLTFYGFTNIWNVTATTAHLLLELGRATISGAMIAAVLGRLPG